MDTNWKERFGKVLGVLMGSGSVMPNGYKLGTVAVVNSNDINASTFIFVEHKPERIDQSMLLMAFYHWNHNFLEVLGGNEADLDKHLKVLGC
jgi:hypothetical protein